MTQRYILDAWAVLALLQGEEPAASRVKELFVEANTKKVELSISLINLGEVVYRIGKSRGEQAGWETLNEIHRLDMTIDEGIDRAPVKTKVSTINGPSGSHCSSSTLEFYINLWAWSVSPIIDTQGIPSSCTNLQCCSCKDLGSRKLYALKVTTCKEFSKSLLERLFEYCIFHLQ